MSPQDDMAAAWRIIRRQERVIEGFENGVRDYSEEAELGRLRLAIMRVRSLHEPDADGACPSCAVALGGGWDVEPVESPCPTLLALPVEPAEEAS